VTTLLYTWDLAKADAPALEIKLKNTPQWFVLSPDGRRIVAEERLPGSIEQKVNVWSSEGKLLKTVAVKDLPRPPGAGGTLVVAPPVFRSNHELLLTQADGFSRQTWSVATVRWDLDRGTIDEIHRFSPRVDTHAVLLRAFSPDRKRVLFFGDGLISQEVAVVNVEPPNAVLRISGNRVWPYYVWSKQGYQIAWGQIAWTPKPNYKLISGIDLKSLQQLPALDPLAFAKPLDFKDLLPKSADKKYAALPKLAAGLGEIANIAEKGFRPLLSVYTAGQDWVVWTPEGYYAASPDGEKLVGWHVNNGDDKLATFHPVERFRKQLYRPDVIKLVLERGSVAAALKAADAALGKETRDVKIDNLLPPRAVLSVVKQDKSILTLKVKAEASVKEQPITSLRLMLDGRIVPGKETLVEFKDGKPKAEVEWTFELPEGEHQLAVLARCPDSSAVSPAIRVRHVDAGKLPTLHVLTIGINHYKDKTLDLKYAAPDAQALAAAFAKHCTGHKKDYYLLTHEADTEKLAETCLSGDALRKALAEYKCQVLLMMDSCYAGSFDQGAKLAKSGLAPATDDATRDLTDESCGVAVLCAARGHEKAEGKDDMGCSRVPCSMRWRRSRACHIIGTISAFTSIICTRMSSTKCAPSRTIASILR
jgi:hypothetical protein